MKHQIIRKIIPPLNKNALVLIVTEINYLIQKLLNAFFNVLHYIHSVFMDIILRWLYAKHSLLRCLNLNLKFYMVKNVVEISVLKIV